MFGRMKLPLHRQLAQVVKQEESVGGIMEAFACREAPPKDTTDILWSLHQIQDEDYMSHYVSLLPLT